MPVLTLKDVPFLKEGVVVFSSRAYGVRKWIVSEYEQSPTYARPDEIAGWIRAGVEFYDNYWEARKACRGR